ncbi:hypothetical protein, variant [Aphanomyces invadans]|uniref:DM10 domain-containing protein n=1 Tax=Aphanomyces invadans TaxID=157072 RepID=A0A024U8G8_9STRA|nr:hypothetical protein, variant [Aphanomyces invadans]ETW02564.1 hypothetical protein, variant [Aphanomyces invadans]|eukprot:XP_008869169.1 hypothetical protein, variant [Aphanomyces invadans]
MADGEVYSFVAEWFDPQAEVARSFLLTYYANDGSLEMVDKKSLKPFLKRIKFPGLKVVDLFVGACVSVYSRQINLVDCANEYTRTLLASRGANTLFLINPAGYRSIGCIISALEACHLSLVKLRMIHIKPNDLAIVCKHVDGMDPSPESSQEWTRDFSVAIEVSVGGPAAVSDALRQLGSARAFIVTGRASPYFFDANAFPTTAAMDDCSTLCLIRPRVVKAGFEISALKLVHVPVAAIDAFLAIYKPVTRQYHELVKYMSSGPLVAVEVRGNDVVNRFQEFCGPFDVQVARELAPTTLRAVFGHTNMQNAVHCTDCPEDGGLETQFFFRVLA